MGSKCGFWWSCNTCCDINQTLEEFGKQVKSSLSHAIVQSYLTKV